MQVDKQDLQDFLSGLAVSENGGDIADELIWYAPKFGFGVAWSDELNRVVFPWDIEGWDQRNKE